MKKITFILIALMIGITTFAQKAEVKAAEKAFKKGDLTTATEMIDKACQLKDQADDKIRAKILYVKAQIFAKKGASNMDDYKTAIATIEELKAFEKKIGKKRYSDDADKLLTQITNEVNAIVNNDLGKKDYKNLAKSAELGYMLTKDDQYKYFGAIANLLIENFEDAEKQLQELYDSGYTGVKEIVTIKNKETGKRETVKDEKEAKIYIMAGTHEDMKKEKTPSARPDIIANLLYVYGKLGKDEEALAFINKAKQEDPNNLDLIIGEGNYWLKKGNNKKFAEAMQRAVELDPDNKLINFNLATAYYQMKKYDDAKKYYEKTLELDPNYVDAYKGLAYIILAPEEKITNEMNKDEVLMNDALYNKYNKQRLDLYREVLPVLEKGLSVAPGDETILVMLKKIYRDLEMKDKFNDVRNKLDKIQGK